MCYASPGPRCSSHALQALQKAQGQWDSATSVPERHAAMAALKEAERQYDATPGGQQTLRKLIADNGDPDGMLSARLEYAIHRRRSMLAAIKTPDRGDVTSVHIDDSPDRPLPSPVRRRAAVLSTMAHAGSAPVPRQHSAIDDAEDIGTVLASIDQEEPDTISDDDGLDPEFEAWFNAQINSPDEE